MVVLFWIMYLGMLCSFFVPLFTFAAIFEQSCLEAEISIGFESDGLKTLERFDWEGMEDNCRKELFESLYLSRSDVSEGF